MALRVGLTGGIASGKSTVSARLVERGAVLVDADALAREVVAQGTPGLVSVVAEFGDGVLTPDGHLDRAALGALVFADAERRAALERIVHPLVRDAGSAREADAGPDAVVVHDIPLLVEVGRAGDFDVVVVVDAPEELQVERMVSLRGMTEEDARARLAAQASREQRLAVADVVIENHGDLAELVARVDAVYDDLLLRARRPH